MLSNFENKSRFAAFDFESIENWWTSFIELDVDNGTDDGYDLTLWGHIRGKARGGATEVSRQHLNDVKISFQPVITDSM